MKKLLMAAALMSYGNLSNAQHFVYGGLGAGIDIFTPKRKVVDTIIATPPLPNLTTTNYNSDSGVGGNLSLFFGVKQPLGYYPFAIACELAAQASSAQAKAKSYYYANLNVNAAASVRNKGNFSISLLPSFYLNNQTEAYLRAGFARGQFEIKSSANTGGNLIATGKTTRWESGMIVGAGLETRITPFINTRLEYDYSQYSSINQASVIPASVNPNNDTIQSRVTPYDHTVMVSVVFHHFM